MNFDDLLGLLIFLGIVVISSIFRGIQEMKKKGEETTPPKSTSPSLGKKLREPVKPPPVRKIVIRKEPSPIYPPPPVFEPTTEEPTETKEDLFEKTEEGSKPSPITISKKPFEEYTEGPHPQEKIPSTTEEKIKSPIKPKTITQSQLEKITSQLKPPKIEISAPMKRISHEYVQHQPVSLSLDGKIGNIPKLQWAVIMMEVLSPPKALRDE